MSERGVSAEWRGRGGLVWEGKSVNSWHPTNKYAAEWRRQESINISLSLSSPSLLTLSSPIFSFTDSHSFPPSPLSLVSLSLPLALKMLLEIMLRFIILRKYFTASVIFLWEEEGRIYECDNQNVKTLLCMKMHAFPQNDEVRDAISLSWPSISEGRSTFEYCFFPQLQVCWSGQMTEVASF